MSNLKEILNVVKRGLAVMMIAYAGYATGYAFNHLPASPPVAASEPRTVQPDLRALFEAVCMVESSGGRNPKAFKENHCRALGIAQVRPCVLEDLKQFAGKRYTLADRLNTEKSWEMFRAYTGLWIKRKGYQDTFENRSRLWFGGPNGPTWKSTEGYWAKVRSHL